MRRLNRIQGQIHGITRRVEQDKYCIDVLPRLLRGLPGSAGRGPGRSGPTGSTPRCRLAGPQRPPLRKWALAVGHRSVEGLSAVTRETLPSRVRSNSATTLVSTGILSTPASVRATATAAWTDSGACPRASPARCTWSRSERWVTCHPATDTSSRSRWKRLGCTLARPPVAVGSSSTSS
ncbi:metal-sensing transcriptional repressor [Kocuria rosea]|uniref:metal-sensing transcriptional repressor n=1 Tax=Kocuria rosea TaxID=1275 RepID=UPI002815E8AB|nr:metal-sensing transcriptional repressor [Kocuria rosea]